MSDRGRSACAELRSARDVLRRHALASQIPVAVAALLAAQANYWDQWFPSEPTATDLAFISLARAIHSQYGQPPTPEADAGTRQRTTQEKADTMPTIGSQMREQD